MQACTTSITQRLTGLTSWFYPYSEETINTEQPLQPQQLQERSLDEDTASPKAKDEINDNVQTQAIADPTASPTPPEVPTEDTTERFPESPVTYVEQLCRDYEAANPSATVNENNPSEQATGSFFWGAELMHNMTRLRIQHLDADYSIFDDCSSDSDPVDLYDTYVGDSGDSS